MPKAGAILRAHLSSSSPYPLAQALQAAWVVVLFRQKFGYTQN
jgi:hypothetical protein